MNLISLLWAFAVLDQRLGYWHFSQVVDIVMAICRHKVLTCFFLFWL